jgi:glycosyltransferase involved in cell wall biosynthesis
VLVLGTLNMGGAERQALLLARELQARHRARVAVVGLSRPGPVAAQCEAMGIPWLISPFRWPCRRLNLVRRLPILAWRLRQLRPEAIIGYTGWANVGCGLVWRLTGAKAFIWSQRSVLPQGLVGSRLSRLAARSSSGWIANCRHAADFLAGAVDLRRELIRVVPNAVSLEAPAASRPEWRERLGVSEGQAVVVMVANLREPKDHGTLISAWRRVLERWPGNVDRPVLALAGRPDARYPQVREQVEHLGIGGNVRILGEVKDVAGLLRASDIGAFCSSSEGLPNAVIECMACGLPVAATDLPGVREALGPCPADLLHPAGDAESLADGLLTLLRNPDRCRTDGERNRLRVDAEFSPEALVNRTLDVINSALSPAIAPETRASGEGRHARRG